VAVSLAAGVYAVTRPVPPPAGTLLVGAGRPNQVMGTDGAWHDLPPHSQKGADGRWHALRPDGSLGGYVDPRY